ncbi:MAG: hypothetical protein Q4A29_07785 [Eubacteriales bacterium]|nr:hypothetical protein [Eubacteriales bacterium]
MTKKMQLIERKKAVEEILELLKEKIQEDNFRLEEELEVVKKRYPEKFMDYLLEAERIAHWDDRYDSPGEVTRENIEDAQIDFIEKIDTLIATEEQIEELNLGEKEEHFFEEIYENDITVETIHGNIPLEDYREIKAVQNGFDSYEDMKRHGIYLGDDYEGADREALLSYYQPKEAVERRERLIENAKLFLEKIKEALLKTEISSENYVTAKQRDRAYPLTQRQARFAIANGIKLETISGEPEKEGEQKGKYKKLDITNKNLLEHYVKNKEGYSKVLTISSEYERAKLNVEGLYDNLKLALGEYVRNAWDYYCNPETEKHKLFLANSPYQFSKEQKEEMHKEFQEKANQSQQEQIDINKEIQSLKHDIEERRLDLYYADAWEQAGQIRKDIEKLEEKLASLEEKQKEMEKEVEEIENIEPKNEYEDSIRNMMKKDYKGFIKALLLVETGIQADNILEKGYEKFMKSQSSSFLSKEILNDLAKEKIMDSTVYIVSNETEKQAYKHFAKENDMEDIKVYTKEEVQNIEEKSPISKLVFALEKTDAMTHNEVNEIARKLKTENIVIHAPITESFEKDWKEHAGEHIHYVEEWEMMQ